MDEPRVIPTEQQVVTICRPNSPPVRIWHALERLMAQTDRLLGAQLREHGLTRAQLSFLLQIGAREGLTQQELAAELGLTKANVSQILDRLEGAGLVVRVPSARAYALHLTDASRSLLGAVMPEQVRLINGQFAGLSPAEQGQLQELIGRMTPDPGSDP